MEPSREDVRTWLQNVIEQTGQTATALARDAGLSSSTLTRFLNSNDDKIVLSFRSIAKIAHAVKMQPPGLSLDAPATRRPAGLQEPEAVPFDVDGGAPERLAAAVHALIRGRNAVDPWVLRTRALEETGYFEGDVVIVDLNAQPVRGDVVCANVYAWAQGKAETIWRVYEPPYLVAASRNPDLRKPLLVDNDRVIIKGVVTESLRARSQRAEDMLS